MNLDLLSVKILIGCIGGDIKLGFNWPAQRTKLEKEKIIALNKKKRQKFNPDWDFCQNAVAEYLQKGGKITKLEIDEESYKKFVSIPESPYAVDEFLRG